LGIGPNPQSPIPNPQSPFNNIKNTNLIYTFLIFIHIKNLISLFLNDKIKDYLFLNFI